MAHHSSRKRKRVRSSRNTQSYSSGIVGLNRLMGKRLKTQKASSSNVEQQWESETMTASQSMDRIQMVALVVGVLIFLLLVVLAAQYLLPEPAVNQSMMAPIPLLTEVDEEDKPPVFTRPPIEIAEIFLAITDPKERLKWVKNPERVRGHMKSYSPQALRATSDQLEPMGMGGTRHFVFARFRVTFPDKETRFIYIIATPNGPLVDWDAYARYNSASWKNLLCGKASSADVRVFAQHSDYYNYLYRDESIWSCYRLTSPDIKNGVYAYVKRGSKQEIALARVPSENNAVPVVLGISTSEEGLKHQQFTIDRVYAFSWMRGERDLDED